jgi:Outer membrane protein beta-barrel domain
MLNLSDKDLDRLSREAASEHDPGDIVGPRSWDKLEIRLDRDLGHVTPHPVRGFYRLPFYYAPVVLLLLGASYYFIRNHRTQKEASSGSPPLTLVKPAPTGADKPSASPQNPTQTDKSTSTLALPPATAEQPTAPAAGTGPGHDLTSGGSTATTATTTSATPAAPATSVASAVPGSSGTGHSAAGPPATSSPTGTAASSLNTGNPATGRPTDTQSSHGAPASSIGRALARPLPTNGHDRSATSSPGSPNTAAGLSASSTAPQSQSGTAPQSQSAAALPAATPPSGERLLSLSTVRGPVPTKRPGSVSDSALRAFTVKATPTPIRRKGGLYINRSLQIGILAAPDFSSVSSMSGDKPGSSIGLTVDYQFAHRWYVGSGLLLSRKNYAAAPQNFHVPQGYDGMPYINYVKGSFNMLEIPLNLRYDFSVAGNTLFFATAGLSSYVATTESCNYYYFPNPSGRQGSKNLHYANRPDYLFSALNLSVGVEMGINNSMSVLVAPYVKVPVRNIGFGQVDLSSVGINFIFEFTPILSRSR